MTSHAGKHDRDGGWRLCDHRDHDFGGNGVVNEVIARARFEQIHQARPGNFQALNGFNPNRATIRKISEDIVSHFQGAPSRDGSNQAPDECKLTG
jgi:hypothetical protein